MAISSGVYSTAFLSLQTPSSFLGSFPASRLAVPPVTLRMLRTVTSATASKPVTGTRKPRGITKPQRVSPEMEAIVGVPEIPRTQALKQIWAYIKEHNLQDPENKRVIVCDEKLKKIFGGKDRVGFLEVAGLVGPHFLKKT
ncbi:hypothetical protein ACOSP7_005080 [Xanthoceras sorbifolium]|uniref:DM2 domain-containing protein n=1 Tax=Xanthoceras sorbifolium TaxID=99658 RepID=A0ABQ8IFD1_9ROSI|nr:hypothetical protein JRO89_XS02G0093600 [Xanthoceras sorbifolium]